MLKSKNVSRNTKIRIYTTILRPIVMYGSESWVMTVREEEWLLRWERKILRKIFGATNDKNGWRMRTNIEIQELFKQPDTVVAIKKGRIRWAGHVQRMPETRRRRWLDDLEEDLRMLGVKGWRRKAEDREEWRHVVKKAEALHGV